MSHRFAALAGALLCMLAAAAAADDPPPEAAACKQVTPSRVVETFMSADCERCWQQASSKEAASPRTLHLDWIVPGRQGDEAPLAAAAIPEASLRLKLPLTPEGATMQRQALPAPPAGARLSAQSGLAWNGYIGLSFELEGHARWPQGAQGWIALVERVPAGEDGTPVARQLVRFLIGPLSLQASPGEHRLQHLRAVRLPANSQAERLAAVGWIAQADGRMLLAAQSPAAGCAPE